MVEPSFESASERGEPGRIAAGAGRTTERHRGWAATDGGSLGRRAFLAGAGAAATALAGCSAVGDPNATGGDSPDLRLAYDGAPPHFQAVVMDEESLYGAVPADLSREEASCNSIVQLLVTGDADVGMIGVIPALVAIDKGPGMHVVGASSSEAFVVMVRDDVAADFEAGDGDPMASFAAERDRSFRLGTYPKGSVSDITARYWIDERLHADRDAVELVHLGGPGAARQALLADEVDGAVIPEPTPTLIESRTDRYRRVDWVGNFVPGEPAGVIVARDEYADAHPDAVEGFIEQHRAASGFITDHPDRAAGYMSEVYGGENALDEATALDALRSRATNYHTDPTPVKDGAEFLAEYAARLGKIDRPYSGSDVFDMTYYDAVTDG